MDYSGLPSRPSWPSRGGRPGSVAPAGRQLSMAGRGRPDGPWPEDPSKKGRPPLDESMICSERFPEGTSHPSYWGRIQYGVLSDRLDGADRANENAPNYLYPACVAPPTPMLGFLPMTASAAAVPQVRRGRVLQRQADRGRAGGRRRPPDAMGPTNPADGGGFFSQRVSHRRHSAVRRAWHTRCNRRAVGDGRGGAEESFAPLACAAPSPPGDHSSSSLPCTASSSAAAATAAAVAATVAAAACTAWRQAVHAGGGMRCATCYRVFPRRCWTRCTAKKARR